MAVTVESRRSFLTGALAGGASGVLAIAAVQGLGSTQVAQAAQHSAVDIGFCTDMSAHHVQALDLCERVLGQDTGGAVQSAATEVLRNQSIEVGMMRAWLTDWGASTAPPETVMAWMADHMSLDMGDMDMGDMDMGDMDMGDMDMGDMDMGDMAMGEMAVSDGGIALADMPGYATPEQLSALALADGQEKGRLWLVLMRAHHVGGVAMAEAALALASEEKVLRLARTQAEVQAYEIGQYDLLLSTQYA